MHIRTIATAAFLFLVTISYVSAQEVRMRPGDELSAQPRSSSEKVLSALEEALNFEDPRIIFSERPQTLPDPGPKLYWKTADGWIVTVSNSRMLIGGVLVDTRMEKHDINYDYKPVQQLVEKIQMSLTKSGLTQDENNSERYETSQYYEKRGYGNDELLCHVSIPSTGREEITSASMQINPDAEGVSFSITCVTRGDFTSAQERQLLILKALGNKGRILNDADIILYPNKAPGYIFLKEKASGLLWSILKKDGDRIKEIYRYTHISKDPPCDLFKKHLSLKKVTACSRSTSEVRTYISKRLGVSFRYLDLPEAKPIVEQEDLIYVGGKEGQFVRKFRKNPKDDLKTTVKKQFLKGYPKQCVVVDSKFHPFLANETFEAAEIINTKTRGNLLSQFVCTGIYEETNGKHYFWMDKRHPNSFYFFSIGQYPILADSAGLKNWEETFRVLN